MLEENAQAQGNLGGVLNDSLPFSVARNPIKLMLPGSGMPTDIRTPSWVSQRRGVGAGIPGRCTDLHWWPRFTDDSRGLL